MDIIDDFLSRLAQHAPELKQAVPVQLERELRQTWGGTEPYVGKRLNTSTRTALISTGLRQQRSLREVFATSGVSRATGYRLLARKTGA